MKHKDKVSSWLTVARLFPETTSWDYKKRRYEIISVNDRIAVIAMNGNTEDTLTFSIDISVKGIHAGFSKIACNRNNEKQAKQCKHCYDVLTAIKSSKLTKEQKEKHRNWYRKQAVRKAMMTDGEIVPFRWEEVK